MMMMMMMCVCVDIAPGMYLCVLHVLMVCSLCYIWLPTIWGAPPHCAKLVHTYAKCSASAHPHWKCGVDQHQQL